MAYMNQEKKAKLAPAIKAICKKHGIKASLAVHNYSTLVLNIKAGKIDFLGNYARDFKEANPQRTNIQVNTYWYRDHFSGEALAFLSELIPAMNQGNHDRSDIQTDYFDVGWYIDVNVGRWDKPYELLA